MFTPFPVLRVQEPGLAMAAVIQIIPAQRVLMKPLCCQGELGYQVFLLFEHVNLETLLRFDWEFYLLLSRILQATLHARGIPGCVASLV